MLLGRGGPGQGGGGDLASGVELGAVGCLGNAADQQRVTRAVVVQVIWRSCLCVIYDQHCLRLHRQAWVSTALLR
jgi:hypothetical protein